MKQIKFSCFNKIFDIMNCVKYCTKVSYQQVSHVIFDLDGTVVDSEKKTFLLYKNVAKSLGKKYEAKHHLFVLGRKEQEGDKIVVEKLGLHITPEEFGRLRVKGLNEALSGLEIKPGAEKLIKHLHKHKVKMAIATSSGKEGFEIKTGQHKALFGLFSHFVVSASDPEVVQGKPAPDIFLIAAKRFSDTPKPEKCLVFEDAPNGVKSAIAAGMQVVMVPEAHISMSEAKALNPTLILNSLEEFEPQLFGLPPF